jgi:deoxyadenosine/deoxycytidine kinase
MKRKYISVEGNIGVGKSTFVKRFAELSGYTPIYEQFSENPFLAPFYEDPKKHSFPLEMSFLAERYQQLNKIFFEPDLFSTGYIADYSFLKTLIFAGVNLSEGEYEVFKSFHKLLSRHLPLPDLIIYLQAPVLQLQENISNRGRLFEQRIDPDYLHLIEDAYVRAIGELKTVKVLRFSYSNERWSSLDELVKFVLSSEIE